MNKRLLLFLFGGLATLALHAQSKYLVIGDLTPQIENADFLADEPQQYTIRTYDYDMPDAGAGSDVEGCIGYYGQQPVTGWTAVNQSDNIRVSESSSIERQDGLNARAAGIFSYVDDTSDEFGPGLGTSDYVAPYQTEGITKQGLGFVSVWSHSVQYTQSITLPAGDYMFIVKINNGAGTNSVNKNLIGFITDEGTEYLSTRRSWPVETWEEDTVIIRLEADASGVLSLGYTIGGVGSGGAPHLFVDNVRLYSIDSKALDQEEIDAAKVDLLEVINQGLNYNVDVTEAQAVYDNPKATLQEVLDAIEKQKKLNEEGLTDLSEYFITNPHFNLDATIEDGICTYDYDMSKNSVEHFGAQPLQGWVAVNQSDNILGASNRAENGRASGVYSIGSGAFLGGTGYLPPKTMSDGTEEGKVLGFVTCWDLSVQYRQQVVLPAGKYSLSISYYNSGGASAISKNLIGFIADDGTEHLFKKTSFTVGSWLKESIEFELTEQTSGYFSLGYTSTHSGSGNMPHFFVDGIALVYVGVGINPSFIALQAAVDAAKEFEGEAYYEELQNKLNELIDAGESLLDQESTDEEENKKVIDAITELLPEVRANVNAYKALEKFYDEGGDLAQALEKYNEDEYPELNAEINIISDQAMEALGDYNLTTDEVNAIIASLAPTIQAAIQKLWDTAVESKETLDSDLDISPVFSQLSFEGAYDQWISTSSSLKTSYATAENWNATSFTTMRTLTDMPAGTYTITTRAFYRNASNAANYDNYMAETYEPQAFLFAGNNTAPIANVVAVASTNPDEITSSVLVGNDLYVPNTQQGAYQVFSNDKYAEIVETTVSTVLEQDGNLTFGIRASGMQSDCWVVWYEFSIAYNALNDDLLDQEIARLNETSADMINDSELRVNKSQEDLESAIISGEDALESNTDAKVEAILKLKDAIAYAQQSLVLLNAVNNTANEYIALRETYQYDSSDDTFDDIIAGIGERFYTDNDEIPTASTEIASAWVAYVTGKDMEGASTSNPIDITEVIINPTFTSNYAHWTFTPDSIENPIGQNQQRNSSAYENTEDGVAVSSFIEAWRPNGTHLNNGIIGQTIAAALPQGFYRLEVDGFATNQDSIPEEGLTGAYLMASDGSKDYLTSMAIETTGAKPYHFVVEFYSDGTTPVTVGLKLDHTDASWIVADNFCLSYIGTEPPVAIIAIKQEEGIEGAAANSKAMYNIAGQRVSTVHRGLYIVDGVKVLIK